jgi:hypothetical protein
MTERSRVRQNIDNAQISGSYVGVQLIDFSSAGNSVGPLTLWYLVPTLTISIP